LRSGFDLVLDEEGGIGPAAGLLAAHGRFPGDAWLVVACDLARLGPATLAALVSARDPARAGVAYRSPVDGLPEPLCAIYEPATLSRFRALIRSGGSPSPRDLLTVSDALLLAPPEAVELFNVNTPDDLRRLQEDGA
jgi:molybdopterin-guanine dinucleotide biosynthesis protein A